MSANPSDPSAPVTQADLQAALKELQIKLMAVTAENMLLRSRITKLEELPAEIQNLKKSTWENQKSFTESWGNLCTTVNMDREQVDTKIGNLKREFEGKLRDQEYALKRYADQVAKPVESDQEGSQKDDEEPQPEDQDQPEQTGESKEDEPELEQEPEPEDEPEEITNPHYQSDLTIELEFPIQDGELDPRASEIFSDPEYQESNPLSFLSSRLSQFTKATRIFTTRKYKQTNVAAEFHQACDNIPNTLVIIKSGQYIAGGYTEVAWSSTFDTVASPQSFLFTVPKKLVFASRATGDPELMTDADCGPVFNDKVSVICIAGDFRAVSQNYSRLDGLLYENDGVDDPETVMFGQKYFAIDEYEVYKLE